MGDVSVIIVSWNAREFLKGCLHSLQAHGGALIREIIVVDNASNDGSAEMVEKDFTTVSLIRTKENLGFARANNLGLQAASGDLLALINSDVVVHAKCLQRLAAFLESHGTVGLAGPKVFGGDGQLQRTCRRLPTVWNTICRAFALDAVFSKCSLFSGREMRHWDQEDDAEVEVLSGCFWLARRKAVEQVGGFDERFFFYAEDVDWCKRFRDAGWRVVFVSTATATHFGGGSSANAPLRYSIEMLRANLAYWKKHFGIVGQAVFYSLTLAHHTLRFVIRGLNQLAGRNPGRETDYFLQRSQVCLRWLLTGRGV